MENTKNTTKKLWQITLYDNVDEFDWLSLKEKHLVKQYEQLQGYVKSYKKEMYSWVNPDSQFWEVNVKDRRWWVFTKWELRKIKLDNIEVFNSNVELERLGKLEHWILPLRKSQQQKQRVKNNVKKLSTQQQINNNVDMRMSWLIPLSPLDYVENKYRAEILKQKTKENINIILRYKKIKEKLAKAYKNGKNKNILTLQRDFLQDDILNEVFVVDDALILDSIK